MCDPCVSRLPPVSFHRYCTGTIFGNLAVFVISLPAPLLPPPRRVVGLVARFPLHQVKLICGRWRLVVCDRFTCVHIPIVNSARLNVLRKPPARCERLRLRGLHLSGERVLIFDMARLDLPCLDLNSSRENHAFVWIRLERMGGHGFETSEAFFDGHCNAKGKQGSQPRADHATREAR